MCFWPLPQSPFGGFLGRLCSAVKFGPIDEASGARDEDDGCGATQTVLDDLDADALRIPEDAIRNLVREYGRPVSSRLRFERIADLTAVGFPEAVTELTAAACDDTGEDEPAAVKAFLFALSRVFPEVPAVLARRLEREYRASSGSACLAVIETWIDRLTLC